jgi:hypothetical protein
MLLQAGQRRAGMDREGLDRGSGGAAGEFQRVDDVGPLGLGVGAHRAVAPLTHQVFQSSGRPPRGEGADRDDAGRR